MNRAIYFKKYSYAWLINFTKRLCFNGFQDVLKVEKKMSKIEINNIYKIFGNKPDSIMPMVQNGATKDEVLEQTGHTVGLDNVSLNIEEGETFVCMGLSGSGKSTLIRHLNRLIDPTAGEILIDVKML